MEIELLPGEEVRDVVGYEGLYQVSSYGGVWKVGPDGKAVKSIRVYREGAEYVRIPLSRGTGQKRQWHYPHRLVAMAFIANPNNLPIINHIDGDKSNCRWDNLEWCTYYDNQQHACDTGLNSRLKLSAEDKYQICESYHTGSATVAQLAEKYGVAQSAIYKHIKNYDRIKALLTRK
jgi:HNH endonuclease.